MIVQLQGKKVSLDPSAVLGAGGEATVFALDEQTAIKVFHSPSKDREIKLNAALQRTWPAPVVAPHALVLDARGSKVVGFTMNRVGPDLEPLSSMFRRSARKTAGLNTADIVAALRSLASTLDTLHQAGVVVGDLNDQNELWARGEAVRLIDADSFQHDGLPCLVATESYLAPELYGVDLSARACFSPAHDRYAFAVLAFRALLCVHPFGGTTSVDQLTPRSYGSSSVGPRPRRSISRQDRAACRISLGVTSRLFSRCLRRRGAPRSALGRARRSRGLGHDLFELRRRGSSIARRMPRLLLGSTQARASHHTGSMPRRAPRFHRRCLPVCCYRA